MTYASGTTVTVANSQQEIARTLHRYQIDTYTFGQMPGLAQVEFVVRSMPVRIRVDIPTRPAKQLGTNPSSGRQVDLWKAHDQQVKERWRALLLFIKASLESVELGIVTPEQAFMAFLVTGDGDTLGDKVLPAYRASIESGTPLAIAK